MSGLIVFVRKIDRQKAIAEEKISLIFKMDPLSKLRQKVKELQKELEEEKAKNASIKTRSKIDHMSAEVVDSNPYR